MYLIADATSLWRITLLSCCSSNLCKYFQSHFLLVVCNLYDLFVECTSGLVFFSRLMIHVVIISWRLSDLLRDSTTESSLILLVVVFRLHLFIYFFDMSSPIHFLILGETPNKYMSNVTSNEYSFHLLFCCECSLHS